MADYEEKNNDLKSYTLFNNDTGYSFEIPVLKGTLGPNVLDITSLYERAKVEPTEIAS